MQTNAFAMMRQGQVTNTFSKIISDNAAVDSITGTATMEHNGMVVKISNYQSKNLELRASTHKLLDAAIAAMTAQGAKCSKVNLSLGEYMDMCGLKDRKEARQQVQRSLEVLTAIRISFNEKMRDGIQQRHMDIGILDSCSMSRNGIITFAFAEEFIRFSFGARSCRTRPSFGALIHGVIPIVIISSAKSQNIRI